MTPLEFLAVVLPTPGNGLYCAAELTNKKHVYAQTLEELQPAVNTWDSKDYDCYFALSTFADAGNRETVNAVSIKSIFIDMDGYATKKEAGTALAVFLDHTGLSSLGAPWFVSSGGGIHAYWPLSENVAIDVWKPVAESLKRLCKQEGLVIDMNVTADPSRILRYPGTRNHKKKYDTPRVVKILSTGDTFELDAFRRIIDVQLKSPVSQASPSFAIPGAKPKNAKKALVALMPDRATKFEPIWLKAESGTGCAQLKNYIDNPTQDGLEPVWRGLLSWAKVCLDGQQQAYRLSALHPYDMQRTDEKMAAIKGPYPCTKMDSENPGVCETCRHWGKITNPLVMGSEVPMDNEPKTMRLKVFQEPAQYDPRHSVSDVSVDPEEMASYAEPVVPMHEVLRPPPPKGFSYGAKGGVYCERVIEDDDGTKSKKQVQILPYDMFVIGMLKMEAEHLVHVLAMRPDGHVTFTMPSRCVVSKDETAKMLAAQNIIASHGQGNDKNLFEYIRGSVEMASQNRALEVPQQCGWQKDGSFVYNNRVFTKDGIESVIPMVGLENINRATNSSGSLEEWRKLWDMFTRKKMFGMLAMCMDSFACPLMRFTEYDGFVWHISSTSSGTGKTLALSAKAGVWGHPIRYRVGKSTSPVAMQQRAGLLNSMPLLIDEITSKGRNDMEWAPAFIFDIAEGQGKERMESGANKERINNSTWSLTCTTTANMSLTDYMSGVRAHSSNGELMRMLEWKLPEKPLVWEDEDKEALLTIKKNYGVAGEAWVRWISANQPAVAAMVSKVHIKLIAAMGFTDEERYWHSGCTTIVAACILMGDKYAGLLNVPVEAIIAELKTLVDSSRANIKRNIRTVEDVLNSFTREFYGQFVIIKKNDAKNILSSWGNGDTVDKSITRSKVLGRVEHGMARPGFVDYFIEEQLLKQHCVAMSFGYADFRTQLEALWSVTYIKKDMMAKTNGPPMRVNVVHISRKETADEDTLPLGTISAG